MGKCSAPIECSETARNLAGVVAQLTGGVAVCRDGCIAWASEGFAELCAVEPDWLVGQSIDSLWEETGDGRPRADAGEVYCRVRGIDELLRSVAVRVIPVAKDPEAEVCCASPEQLWAIRDMTPLRTVERELLRTSRALNESRHELATLRDRADEAAAEREELLAVVSHELRTPVTVISGYNRLLLAEEVGSLTADQRRYLRESAKSCKNLDAFIGNLLEASRTARGEAALDLNERSLEPIVLSVTGFLRPLLDERGIRLELDLEPEALWGRFDGLRVEQVLTNLLGNAIRYAKEGGVVSVATLVTSEGSDEFIGVRVCDDGPGVAHADQVRIFEPYVRGSQSRPGGALGLGLAICKRIVDAHGGRIAVRDREGGGSCFEFTVPRAVESRDAMTATTVAKESVGA